MKYFIIIITLFLLGLGALFVLHMEVVKKDQLKQAEINFLRKRNAEEKDSLTNVLNLQSDSLIIAKNTILVMHEQSIKAKEKSERERNKFESIIFIRYDSDSARLKAIKQLYKTFQP